MAKGYDALYVEVFPEHESLLALLDMLGFTPAESATARPSEQVWVKALRPRDNDLDPHEYHRRYGPPALKIESAYIVPIWPTYVERLFPDAARAQQLFAPAPCGNAVLKAYLCRSGLREVERGATLLFYETAPRSRIVAAGVAEQSVRLREPARIRRWVGSRTVYSDAQIRKLSEAGKSEVLCVKFRFDHSLVNSIPLDQLKEMRVLKAAPQSFTQVKSVEGLRWLQTELSG